MAKFTQGTFASENAQSSNDIALPTGLSFYDTRASRSYVWTNDQTKGNPPEYDLRLFKEMVENDPIISTSFDATVDVATMNGYDFFSKRNSRLGIRQARELLNTFKYDLNFDEILDNIIRSLITYGITYLEKRKAAEKIRELYVLETTEMAIKWDEHGTINGYVQTNTKEAVFTPEEIIYFKLKPFGNRVYGMYPLEPIARDYATNIFANTVLQNIFRNMPPKMLYILKNANQTQRKVFIENLRIAKQNPSADLVALGEADSKPNVLDLDAGLSNLLKHLRRQIFAITRVPPFWLGILEDAGDRGNTEAQIFAFETRIRKIQQIIENKINMELLPAMGYNNVLFRFNPFSLRDEKNILENAERMRALGIKKDKIAEFLTLRGLTVHADEIEELDAQMPGSEKLSRDMSSADRPRMDKNMDEMRKNLNKEGTSDLSQEKRPDLEGRSTEEIYDQYEEEYLKPQGRRI